MRLNLIIPLVLTIIFKVYSQPQLIIHLIGEYDLPLPDLKGNFNDTNDIYNTYRMNSGFGFGAEAKYYFDKKRNFGAVLNANIRFISNSEDTAIVYNSNLIFPVSDLKTKMRFITLGLGLEYAVNPKGKINPFIGAEFTGNFISGEYDFTLDKKYTIDLETAARFGISAGIGAEIALNKSIGMVFGAKYNFANLIGKEADTSYVSGKYFLNDKEYTDILGRNIPARNISYMHAYLGISFYLNKPGKK